MQKTVAAIALIRSALKALEQLEKGNALYIKLGKEQVNKQRAKSLEKLQTASAVKAYSKLNYLNSWIDSQLMGI